MEYTSVSTLIDQAAQQCLDDDMVRWDKSFWVNACNLAINQILMIRPDALSDQVVFKCKSGSTQELTNDIRYIIKIIRNVGGKAVSGTVDLAVLDDYRPDWRNQTPAKEIQGWMYDERTPKVFQVYPPVEDDVEIEMLVSLYPSEITGTDYDTDAKSILSPLYDNAVIEWMIYLAFNVDSEFAANSSKAQTARQNFRELLGDKGQADSSTQARRKKQR